MKPLKLNGKLVGDGNPCYFIAEIGGLFKNFEEAKRLIDSAIEIGIDSVKFQTLDAETISTKNNLFDMENTGKVSQYELFKDFEIPKDVQKVLIEIKWEEDFHMLFLHENGLVTQFIMNPEEIRQFDLYGPDEEEE